MAKHYVGDVSNSAIVNNNCVEFGRSTKRQAAFTMAEILLSLTIIGVVAAITLPSLTGNINERTWNTQRKALYARMSQAISLMPHLNGYGTLEEGDPNNVAETFITNGLAKVLKINNICDSENLKDCGIPDKITPIEGATLDNFTTSYNTLVAFNDMFNGSYTRPSNNVTYSYEQTDTKAAAFETANGESIVVYYNPHCAANMQETNVHFSQPKMCANFVYDLNGSKGPNTVGKDIGFIAALYPTDPIVVAPVPLAKKVNNGGDYSTALGVCNKRDEESRLPNREELTAMFYNKALIGDLQEGDHWSGSMEVINGSKRAWTVHLIMGQRATGALSGTSNVTRCIKR